MFDSDDDEISLISDATFNDPLASVNGAAPQPTDLPDPPSIAAVPIIDDVPVVEIASSDEDDDDDNSKKSQNFPTTNVDDEDDEFLMVDIPVKCMVAIENNSDDDLMVEIPSPNSNKNELQSDASSSASSSRKSTKRENELRQKRTETLKQIETYNAKKAEMLAKVSFCYNPEASLVKKQLKETRKERRARLRAENRNKLQPQQSKALSEAMIRSQRAAKRAALDQLNKERQESYQERREQARKANEDAQRKNAHIWLEKEMRMHELQKLQLLKKQSKSIAQKLINSRVTSTELRQSGEEKTIKKVTPDGTVHEFSIKLFDNEDDFINHNLSLNYALFMS